MKPNRWSAVIPAFNAADTIQEVVSGVSAYIQENRILVVDDGSEDDTGKLVEETGAVLQQRLTNGGKGTALREAFMHSVVQDSDWVICLDSDGQHDPKMIPAFQKEASRDMCDLIIGNRSHDQGDMPLLRRFSNHTSSLLLSWRTGLNLPDIQCGYRAVRTSMLKPLNLKSESYEIEVEMILRSWKTNYRIGWIPILAVYQGETSYLRKVPETIRFLKLFARSFYE
ncbi:hypothetical protein CEE37_04595 [candidate division LCP-89 bacterium B3_LCP]|uniref:Glycosyltransferase 2-like domain-containing protein n=1 Tax=candidate division LCP-89 bacterium B3_LCP TaxID=2012998 RepID=A0A532V3Q6_UNCL8|nr:MAG: hypothetical protein CEE37_04595 [candidate division LCP-89 bacterium B3_LCP]